jgi:hypothetical protein
MVGSAASRAPRTKVLVRRTDTVLQVVGGAVSIGATWRGMES